MKRTSTNKVKAVPSGANGNSVLEGHLKLVHSEGNRRARTSAAMIGLAISMGASSLLLPRQSDRAMAAEPIGNEPTAKTAPAAETNVGGLTNPVEPEAVSSEANAGASAAVVPPTHPVPQASVTSSKPVAPVIAHTVQEGQTLWQLSKSYEVDAAAIAASNGGAKHPDLKAGQVIKIPAVNGIVHEAQVGETVETLSESYGVEPSQIAPPTEAAASEPFRVGESVTVAGEVNALLKAKQGVALNRLKQKSNRLKDSLAELRVEESSNSFESNAASVEPSEAVGTQTIQESLEEPVAEAPTTVEQEQMTSPTSVAETPETVDISPTTSQENFEELVEAEVPDSQQQPAVAQLEVAKPEAAIDESGALDESKSEETPVNVMVPKLPNAVTEPTVVVASVLPGYQVKPGDTLAAIARKHNISLSALVKVNHLNNPNKLRINQRLTIPPGLSRAASRTVAAIPSLTESEPTASSLALTQKTVSSNPTVPVVPPVSQLATKGSDATPTLPPTDELQANAELIASQNVAEQGQARVTLPAKTSIADATFLPDTNTAPSLSGVGGAVPPASAPQQPLTSSRMQLAKSAAAKRDLPANPYVQNLRLEIEKLRAKYRAQQTGSPVIPEEVESNSVALPIPPQFDTKQPEADEPINPEFLPNRASETSQETITIQPRRNSSPVRARVPQRLATAPIGVDASESLQSLRGRQVSPELPPLATGDTYLPSTSSPFDTSAPAAGYIWPTKGILTSGYGWRWGRMHRGIDIAAPIGTPVVAAAPGVVIKAGWNSGGYGKLVDIQHADGSVTRYAHNHRILVQVGQQVEQGQQISEMGSTGYSTGPHCHFELRPAGRGAVNPIAFLPRRGA